jgi:exopolyphosphatase / guanosine-5'-triphosphate,3'-diphosphate pyrophosphatase
MRVATIDIGTNSVLLLVAEVTPAGLVAVEERATVTRLGQDVDRTGVIQDAAFERTAACLEEYATRIRACGAARVAIAGTSALRDARGGERVARFVESCLGAPLRVISGHEEARLTFLGATSGLGSAADPWARTIAFDVGGGSTEIVQGSRASQADLRLEFAESFDIGSVRLTERHIHTDPPSTMELRAATEAAEEAFADLPTLASDAPPIGIAGTVTTLAAVALGMNDYDGARVHGQTLAVSDLERIVGQLAALPLADRRRLAGVHPGRADVIVAGGLVVLAVLRRLGAEVMRVSDRGLRWGLADELVTESTIP